MEGPCILPLTWDGTKTGCGEEVEKTCQGDLDVLDLPEHHFGLMILAKKNFSLPSTWRKDPVMATHSSVLSGCGVCTVFLPRIIVTEF